MGPPRRMITSHDYDIADRRTHVCPLGRFFCEYYVHPSFNFTTVMFTLPLYMILILMQHVLLGHASQRMNEKKHVHTLIKHYVGDKTPRICTETR